MKELLITEKQDLQDIADKLKVKAGRTDKIKYPNEFLQIIDELGNGGVELPELSNEGSASDLLLGKQLINGEGNVVTGNIETFDGSYEYGEGNTGGPTSESLEGLKNGYDVMFYDEFNKGLTLVSVRKGLTVDAPHYSCKAWQTENGESQFFPFTPSSDIAFYANNNTLEKILYEYYNIDKAAYPYVFISYRIGTGAEILYYLSISFGKSVSGSGSSTKVTGLGARINMTENEIGDFSPEHVVNLVMQVLPILSDNFSTHGSQRYNYSNFSMTSTHYRLDE